MTELAGDPHGAKARAAAAEVPLALIIPILKGGGAERVISRLSLHYATNRPVAVITWDGRDPAYEYGGRVFDLGLPAAATLVGRFLRQRQRCSALIGILRQQRITHAIAFMEAAGVPLAMAKQELPGLHATVSIRAPPHALGRIAKLQIRRWYPGADRVVLQTRAGMEQVQRWGIPADKCTVIPNPLPGDMLRPVVPFGSRDPGLVLAIGRLEVEKDFITAIRAFSRLPAAVARRLVILGEGSQRGLLVATARKLGVESRVDLPGQVHDVGSWLDRARLLVVSSLFEGFPNVLAEAMARGCPVVSTDCPLGPAEMIDRQNSGWLVPIGDSVAMSSAMGDALVDGGEAERRASNARLRAEQWNIERIAEAWLV